MKPASMTRKPSRLKASRWSGVNSVSTMPEESYGVRADSATVTVLCHHGCGVAGRGTRLRTCPRAAFVALSAHLPPAPMEEPWAARDDVSPQSALEAFRVPMRTQVWLLPALQGWHPNGTGRRSDCEDVRAGPLAVGLVTVDLRGAQLGERDVVPAVQEPIADAGIDVERRRPPRRQDDRLGLEVDRGLGGRRVEQLAHVRLGQRHDEKAVLRGVRPEDVAEALGDDRLEPELLDRPGRVLARAAAAEVAAGGEDRRGGELWPPKRE